ncbi:MAG: TIGR01777 family oxidoreductase [Cyclobacteriaceae bacterium]
MKKKIVIAGGNGFLGRSIMKRYPSQNIKWVVLTRRKVADKSHIKYVPWDGQTLGSWASELENAEALINLAGKSVDCRYNEKNKREIYNSRVRSTAILGVAVNQCIKPPKAWVNAASATIYRDALDRPMDEATGEYGTGFSVDVCQKWERTFNDLYTPHTRKILLRIAVVLGADGQALPPMLKLVSMGMGGRQGNGSQMVSWIHEQDFVNILHFCLNKPQIIGTYNAASPHPVANWKLMALLRRIKKIPFGLPIPKFLLSLGAWLIGTEAELVLKSRWVLPTKLEQSGFVFDFGNLEPALEDLCA